jgi:hypothetical protein
MSQAGIINVSGSGGGVVETLTGNSGGAVGPTGNNINVVGIGAVDIVGDPGTSTLTVSVSGAGLVWSDISTSQSVPANAGYFSTATLTATLPASPNEGDTVNFIVDTASILTIQASGTQKIRVGTNISAAGGKCVNQDQGDGIELVYRATGTTWISFASPQGTWTVT